MGEEKLKAELYPVYDFLSSKVRNLLTDPIELYTKWGMVKGAIKGMHLRDRAVQKDVECYMLKEDWSNDPKDMLNTMVVPVRGNYFTVFQYDPFIEIAFLKEMLQKSLEEYEAIEKDENPEIIRNVHFFFYLEKIENQEEHVETLKQMIHELFEVKVLSSKLQLDDNYDYINLQIIGTFLQDELSSKLYPWFSDAKRWENPYGITGTSCLLENVQGCHIDFKRY